MEVRLPDVPKFAMLVVQAPFEDVLEYFRCVYHEQDDQSENLRLGRRPFCEVRGDDIAAARAFGYCEAKQYGVHQDFEDFYRIWGRHRLSTAPGRPDLVLVEGVSAHNEILSDLQLAIFLQRPVYAFSSRIAWDPTSASAMKSAFDPPKGAPGEHVLRRTYGKYARLTDQSFDNRDRTVWVGYDGRRWRWQSSGEPETFEQVEAYTARRKADRLTRNMICDYMEAVGVHPERTLIDRDVENVVLFSTEYNAAMVKADPDMLAAYNHQMENDGVDWGSDAADDTA